MGGEVHLRVYPTRRALNPFRPQSPRPGGFGKRECSDLRVPWRVVAASIG